MQLFVENVVPVHSHRKGVAPTIVLFGNWGIASLLRNFTKSNRFSMAIPVVNSATSLGRRDTPDDSGLGQAAWRETRAHLRVTAYANRLRPLSTFRDRFPLPTRFDAGDNDPAGRSVTLPTQ